MPKTRDEYNTYMAQYMTARIARRRAEAVQQLGSKCARCGSTENLEFDHPNRDPDPRGRRNRGTMWTFSEKRLQEELRKCQLLCHDCHQEKTLNEISVSHGGGLSGKKNCPCAPCKKRKSAYMKVYDRDRRGR